MKKKILSAALVVALLAIMVGGTLAYFTDEDSAANVFTIGSVEIKVEEVFTQPDAMLPIVNGANPSADANYIKKEAKITNLGKNDAYVQAFVAIPAVLDNANAFILENGDLTDWTKSQSAVAVIDISGVSYNVYKYVYNKVLKATDPDTSTPLFIKGAYLNAALDARTDENGVRRFVMNGTFIDGFNIDDPVNVYVAAQAVQADGFGETAAAAVVLAQAFGDTLPTFTA